MSKIENFELDMPLFGCKRKIWVYLPEDYDEKGKPYPVIYMQDGQNLFYKDLTLYGDTWRADTTMEKIRAATGRAAIVAGVENSRKRLLEYSPWETSHKDVITDKDNIGGRGADYAEFFSVDVRKAIENRYNAVRDRKGRAVLGSSAGGLISCYIALRYQEVFETAGLFSTACWFNEEALRDFMDTMPQRCAQHVSVYAGGKEDIAEIMPAGTMVENSIGLYKRLAARGISCELLLNSDLRHNENAWAIYFYKFADDFLRRFEERE